MTHPNIRVTNFHPHDAELGHIATVLTQHLSNDTIKEDTILSPLSLCRGSCTGQILKTFSHLFLESVINISIKEQIRYAAEIRRLLLFYTFHVWPCYVSLYYYNTSWVPSFIGSRSHAEHYEVSQKLSQIIFRQISMPGSIISLLFLQLFDSFFHCANGKNLHPYQKISLITFFKSS